MVELLYLIVLSAVGSAVYSHALKEDLHLHNSRLLLLKG